MRKVVPSDGRDTVCVEFVVVLTVPRKKSTSSSITTLLTDEPVPEAPVVLIKKRTESGPQVASNCTAVPDQLGDVKQGASG